MDRLSVDQKVQFDRCHRQAFGQVHVDRGVVDLYRPFAADGAGMGAQASGQAVQPVAVDEIHRQHCRRQGGPVFGCRFKSGEAVRIFLGG